MEPAAPDGGQNDYDSTVARVAGVMFLTAEPLWASGVLIVGVGTGVGVAAPILIRRSVGLESLRTNNEVAGFKFATVGVLYAVLLAFAVILAWERFNTAEAMVAQEAGAAASIYRLAAGIGGREEAALRGSVDAYLRIAIGKDWPAMARGGESPAASHALTRIYASALSFHPADRRGSILLAELLRQVDALTAARRERLVIADGGVPFLVWLVLFAGGALTIGFTFFFGSDNVRAQAMMSGMLALLISLQLLVIVAIDLPFTGQVKVEPHALATVLRESSLP